MSEWTPERVRNALKEAELTLVSRIWTNLGQPIVSDYAVENYPEEVGELALEILQQKKYAVALAKLRRKGGI